MGRQLNKRPQNLLSRALLILDSQPIREKACAWVHGVPDGTRLTFNKPRRTLDQNSRFWAMLTDIAEQKDWHGIKLNPEDWRLLFLDALSREVRAVPNLDGTGFVNLRRSSDLSKEEMAAVIDIIGEWGARNGVTFHDGVGQGPTSTTGGGQAPGMTRPEASDEG